MLDQADSNMMLDSMPGMASVHSNNVGDLPGRMKMGIANAREFDRGWMAMPTPII